MLTSSCRPHCLRHSRRQATAADIPQRRFLPSGKDKEYESAGSSVISVILDANFHYFSPQKPCDTSSLLPARFTNKVLSPGILSSSETLVCLFFFSKFNIYILKNITSVHKVGSYGFSKGTAAGWPPIWSQKAAHGDKEMFWVEPPRSHSEDLV